MSCVNEARTDSVTASSSPPKIASFILDLVVNKKLNLNFFLPLSYRHTPTLWSTSKHIKYMCMFSAHHSNTNLALTLAFNMTDRIWVPSWDAGPFHPLTLAYNASCYSTDIKLGTYAEVGPTSILPL